MIKLDHVYKELKNHTFSNEVLKDVQVHIKDGEWISIVGPSGTGKTTLLHILSGLVEPDQGTVHFQDKDIYQMQEAERSALRRKNIGFVFQDFKLLPYYSVIANVTLPLYDAKDKQALKKRAGDLLDMVGIDPSLFSRLPEGLSGGEKQRVAIARALIADPDVLICDEPTGNVDVENRNHIIKLLDTLRTQGKTIVLVTHDPHVAESADVIYGLNYGQLSKSEVNV